MMTETLTELEKVVRPHLKLLSPDDELTPELNLGEAGLDSMASIDLLLDLEDHFGVTIDDDALTENSFSNLVEIQKLVDAAR